MSKLCIIGDVLIDVTLHTNNNPLKMRLGGVLHCARAMWALEQDYIVAYFAPKYLVSHIEAYLKHFGQPVTFYLGEVLTAPYIMLIGEAKEVGNQGYEFLLRDNIVIEYKEDNLKSLNQFNNFLFISGSYDLHKVFPFLPEAAAINIDLSNNVESLNDLGKIFFKNIFLSTSSTIFQKFYQEQKELDMDTFLNNFKSISECVIFKENRGGSRAKDFLTNETIFVSSQTQPIVHSVGVGDVYNIGYLVAGFSGIKENLSFASFLAMEYASTTYPEDFRIMTQRLRNVPPADLASLNGVSLPWEQRKEIKIYLAAPDFDFVDTRAIDVIEKSLNYHNFVTHRPIKENGQMEVNASEKRKNELFFNDMHLLESCNMLVAILLYNDPGTLIEIGIAAERKIPTIVYDPNKIATNCMLTQLPTLVSSNIDEVVCEIFVQGQKITR